MRELQEVIELLDEIDKMALSQASHVQGGIEGRKVTKTLPDAYCTDMSTKIVLNEIHRLVNISINDLKQYRDEVERERTT